MCSDLLYCEIPDELYLYNVTNDNHMYILFNTHLTIWYNLKIFPSKLATHCEILPKCPILVLNMLSTSRRMMTDLRTYVGRRLGHSLCNLVSISMGGDGAVIRTKVHIL